MKLVDKSAEKKLIEDAKSLRTQAVHAYSIFLHLSQLGGEWKKRDKTPLINHIKQEGNDLEGGLYLCSDSDIVIIIKTKKEAEVQDLVSQIKSFCVDGSFVAGGDQGTLDSSIAVFDLNKEYDAFLAECDQKIKASGYRECDNKSEALDEEEQELLKESFEAAKRIREVRGDRLCVLIIEDQAFSRQLLKESLRQKYITLVAKNAKEGMALYMMNAPDIVLLDIELPDYDGYYVLHNLLKNDEDAFVVMITASSSRNNVKKAITEGAKGYIVKPFTKAKIDEYIKLYLGHFRKQGLECDNE